MRQLANLPLIDNALASADLTVGFDWRALLGWMNEHPTLFAIMRPIYLSLTLQMTTVVLCLSFTGRFVWLRIYTLAFLLAALTTIALSAVLPAAGAWPHYGLTAAASPHLMPTVNTSWPVFFGLRDGSFRALVAVGSEGIISFPSLHAALAVIMMAALWPIARLRWIIIGFNAVMLAATPIDGSHYFIDVWAGIALAVACLLAARAIAARAGAAREPLDSRNFSIRRSQIANLSPPDGIVIARAAPFAYSVDRPSPLVMTLPMSCRTEGTCFVLKQPRGART